MVVQMNPFRDMITETFLYGNCGIGVYPREVSSCPT